MKYDLIKGPVLREKVKNIAENPSGDAIKELTEQDINTLVGAGAWSDFSAFLGNKGAYCTLTICHSPSTKIPIVGSVFESIENTSGFAGLECKFIDESTFYC